MTEQRRYSVGDLRVIAPSTRSVRIALVVFGVMTALGGLITEAAIAHWVQTTASSRVLGAGLIMLLFGGRFLAALVVWSFNARLLVGGGKVGYRSIFRRSSGC